jgi:4-hydroxy-tetrahydrodipicolinate synthase
MEDFNMSIFEGAGVAIVTPFTNGEVDYNTLGSLLEYHVKAGTSAIIICGTTGEASTMSEAERKEAIKFTVDTIAGRIPVIAGTGSNSTQSSIDMSVYAEEAGADGVLVVTPYYNKTTQSGMVAHFNAIANSITIPVILYNVPGRTGLNLLPSTVKILSETPNIVAVKEASGDISQVAEIARLCDDDFAMYSGNDDMIIPLLSLGGKGVISVVANILPTETNDMVMKYLAGNVNEARDMQLRMNGLVNALFIETNPIPIKTAMNILGMNAGQLRLPLTEMESQNVEILKREMANYGFDIRGVQHA